MNTAWNIVKIKCRMVDKLREIGAGHSDGTSEEVSKF